MKMKYDREADALYVYLSDKPYAYGRDLDNERRIDYAADGTPIGIELLSVSKGVNPDDLPEQSEVIDLLESQNIKIFA
ncbi:MAG: DUF2283 domain-containing protein [Dehalococcoidales bacterium]|nr:DUF2283 domain-containing protein [Dehalococcoidales bacterium]